MHTRADSLVGASHILAKIHAAITHWRMILVPNLEISHGAALLYAEWAKTLPPPETSLSVRADSLRPTPLKTPNQAFLRACN